MDKQKLEELDEEFFKIITICSFCDRSLLENKESVKGCKLLECLHSVCEKCTSEWITEEKQCPKCSLQVHKSKLLNHKILEELVDSEEDPGTIRCSMHDTQLATHWCEECADYICERCIENHQQLKVTKDHVIVPKMEHWEHRDKRQGSFPCSVHPSEQLVIFCSKCNLMTCRDCQLATHREHSYEFVDKVIEQAKTDIYDMYKFLTHHQMVLDQAQEVISDRKNKILMRKQSLTKEINIFSAALIEIINKRSQNLISRLEQMTDNKIKLFDTNSQALRKHVLPFGHTIHFVKNVLHSSSDPSIMFSKDQILSHMKRIHYQKSTIPNVVRNLQLKFTSGDITNLMKELQSFGLISLNDEDAEGSAIENAAANLGKAVRLALTKQFAIANSTTGNQAASPVTQQQHQQQQIQLHQQQIQQQQHQQQIQQQHQQHIQQQQHQQQVQQHQQQIQQQHQQQMQQQQIHQQQIPQHQQQLPPEPKGPPPQSIQSVPVTPRIPPAGGWRSPPQKPYPPPSYVQTQPKLPGSSRESTHLPPPPYPSFTTPTAPRQKVSWHTPVSMQVQNPVVSAPTQAVTINKVRIPPQDTNGKTTITSNNNANQKISNMIQATETSRILPSISLDDIIDLDPEPIF